MRKQLGTRPYQKGAQAFGEVCEFLLQGLLQHRQLVPETDRRPRPLFGTESPYQTEPKKPVWVKPALEKESTNLKRNCPGRPSFKFSGTSFQFSGAQKRRPAFRDPLPSSCPFWSLSGLQLVRQTHQQGTSEKPRHWLVTGSETLAVSMIASIRVFAAKTDRQI